MMEELIKYSVTDAKIEELKEKYGEVQKVESNKDLKAVKSSITVVRTYRTTVESKRKELKKDALEWGRKVDAEAKRITAKLLEIEEPMKAEAKAYEDKIKAEKEEQERIERERIEKIRIEISNITAFPLMFSSATSVEIDQGLNDLSTAELFDFQEFKEEAEKTIDAVRETLKKHHIAALKKEQEERDAALERERLKIQQEELEKERRRLEAEEALRKQEAARIEKEAQEKRDAEQKKLDDERAKLAEERAKLEDEKVKPEPEPEPVIDDDVKVSEKPEEENPTITIKMSEYLELLNDQEILRALECVGVNNWEGYDEAMEMINEQTKEIL